jgi:elongation factor P
MNDKTFEQIEFPVHLLGDKAQYLQDGMQIVIESYNDLPVVVQLPMRVAFELTAVDASSGTGTTSTGFKLRVPKHVVAGDRVLIDTADGRYVSKE